MKEKLVWVSRIYSKDFITDFFQDLKNIVGGRLGAYEKMLNKAIEETWKEFSKKYPTARRLKLDHEIRKWNNNGFIKCCYECWKICWNGNNDTDSLFDSWN